MFNLFYMTNAFKLLYIYEGQSTKNYVSEVKNFLWKFETPYLM